MTLLFYLFSTLLVASSAGASLGQNPVHSVLSLILAFFSAAALFLMLGAEFLAFILIVVYAGAVAVLFLFIVMMTNITFQDLKQNVARHLPLAGFIVIVGFIELIVAFNSHTTPHAPQFPHDPTQNNIQQLGCLLYTHYFLAFQMAGLFLLIAIVGATVLTLKAKTKPHSTPPKTRIPVSLVKVEPHQGIKIP